jgi:excisionase family DNA binding protein
MADKPQNKTHSRSNPPPVPFLTIGEIAESLHVSTKSVRRWIKSRSLKAHRFGRSVRVSQPDYAAFLALRRDA